MSNPLLIAVCHTCGHQHGLHANELRGRGVADWEHKHNGHKVELLTPEVWNQSTARNAGGGIAYRHNANIKVAYATSVAYTITLASLATDSNLLTGRESTGVDNTSNLYYDYGIAGVITVGTTPTTAKSIEVIAIGTRGTELTYPDVFDGTDSGETFTSADLKNSLARYVARMYISSTTDRAYHFGLTSLRGLYGGVLPVGHVIFVTHDTAVNLNSTGGNHVIQYTPEYYTVI